MKLTGKSLEQFEKWFNESGMSTINIKNLNHSLDNYNIEIGLLTISDYFNNLPDSMQYGVLVDFFDSVGIIISIEPNWHCGKLETKTQEEVNETLDFDVMVFGSESDNCEYETTKTRPQARIKAIVKAKEIYNNRL